MNQIIVQVSDLSFSYGNHKILEDVNLSLSAGDFAAIIGANGAGKSTLIKLILGELEPQSGKVLLFDKNPLLLKELSQIGYVPQSGLTGSRGFPANVFEVVYANLYLKTRGLFRSKLEYHEKAIEALESVGMADYAKSLIGELSGGQLQRVLLARSLVNDPTLIVLDEPTTGIDTETVQSFHLLLQKLNQEKGITILTVTHDLARVIQFINRTFCLEEKDLLELSKQDVLHELAHRHEHPPLRRKDEAYGDLQI